MYLTAIINHIFIDCVTTIQTFFFKSRWTEKNNKQLPQQMALFVKRKLLASYTDINKRWLEFIVNSKAKELLFQPRLNIYNWEWEKISAHFSSCLGPFLMFFFPGSFKKRKGMVDRKKKKTLFFIRNSLISNVIECSFLYEHENHYHIFKSLTTQEHK